MAEQFFTDFAKGYLEIRTNTLSNIKTHGQGLASRPFERDTPKRKKEYNDIYQMILQQKANVTQQIVQHISGGSASKKIFFPTFWSFVISLF